MGGIPHSRTRAGPEPQPEALPEDSEIQELSVQMRPALVTLCSPNPEELQVDPDGTQEPPVMDQLNKSSGSSFKSSEPVLPLMLPVSCTAARVSL